MPPLKINTGSLANLNQNTKSNLGANIGVNSLNAPTSGGALAGSKYAPYTPTSMGTKAVSPGGLANTQTNTLPKAQQASPADQTATGNAVNSSTVGNGTSGSMGALMNKASTVGTQHPGDPGFNPITPSVHAVQPSNVALYDASGQYTGVTTANGNPVGQAPIPTTSQGAANALAQTSQNGSQGAQTAVSGLNQAPSQNALLSDQAKAIGTNYGAQIAKVSNYGNALAGSYTTGGGLAPVSQGLAGQAQNTTANEVTGLTNAENAALAPINQELTAQNQGQAGLTSAGQIANTSQGNVQSGLNAAGQLTQSQPTAAGQVAFNPATGQFSTAIGGVSADAMNQYAQMAANGQYAAIPASITGNIALSAQLNAAAKVINPNYNPINSTAQGAAGAANIQTAGTVGTSTAASGYTAAAQNYTAYQGANTAAEAQVGTVQNILSSTGLNQGVPDYNQAINTLSGKLGSTKVSQLSTAVTELQNMYSQILSTGGTTPSGSEQQALSVLNPSSSAAQINASIAQLQEAAYNRGTGLYSQLQTYAGNLGQGGSTGNNGSSGGSVQTSYGTINPNL